MPSPSRILVVGASSGMGRAIAVRLACNGDQVLAVARRTDRLEELQRELAGRSDSLSVAKCDVTQREDVEAVVAEATLRFGGIDVLVYATGMNIRHRSLEVLSKDDWSRMIATNLSGAFHCTQAVLPVMRRQQAGLIIYLSTGAVQYPDVSGVAYQAAKHGLTGLAYGTRKEEKSRGIRTTLIFPGLCDTEILNQRPVPTPPETLAKALRPEDVADAVAFVCRLDARCHVPELQLFPAFI
jgi:NADP-dependent 3-hydroxy acid dehydrogenase YdfG